MRKAVQEYLEDPRPRTKAKLTDMELKWADKQLAKKQKQQPKQGK